MILLFFCVLVCEIFYDLPFNKTDQQSVENYDRYEGGIGFISPSVWFQDICNYCWNSSVKDASQYTTFLLFTKQSTPNYTIVNSTDKQSLYGAGFNISTDTKILIHGWLDNGSNTFAEELRNGYFRDENVNIIAVDWYPLSQLFYPLARSAVSPVGRYTARFVDFLVLDVGVSPNSIHLVGHSLGAHIAGVVGENVTFGNLSRITGLDPAAPLFGSDCSGRLDSSDAEFVDVVHTTWDYLGYSTPCGVVDFYPNQGYPIQPGCGIDLGACSHRRAYYYFSESISSLGFISTACTSWSDYISGLCENNTKTVMGEHVDTWAKGNYYLSTNPSSPFAAWNNSLMLASQRSNLSDIYTNNSQPVCIK